MKKRFTINSVFFLCLFWGVILLMGCRPVSAPDSTLESVSDSVSSGQEKGGSSDLGNAAGNNFASEGDSDGDSGGESTERTKGELWERRSAENTDNLSVSEKSSALEDSDTAVLSDGSGEKKGAGIGLSEGERSSVNSVVSSGSDGASHRSGVVEVEESAGFLLESKEQVSVRGILNRMVSAYRKAQTYRDEGEIRISWEQNGNFHERGISYRTNFQRPNHLFMDVNGTSVLANGEMLSAYTPELPGVLLQKSCPKELGIADILCEREINWALMDVESSVFSCIPPPLVLLLHSDPLATFLYQADQSNIRLLPNAEIEGRGCFRISVLRQNEESILWIDSETYVLRRIELPKQQLQKPRGASESVQEEISVSIDFHRAELNWSGVIEVTPPTNCVIVSSFTETQKQLLGKPAPDFKFMKLNGPEVSLQDLANRVLFIYFWSIYETNTLNFQEIGRLYSKFQSNEKIHFLGVNIDPKTVSNEKIQQFAENQGLQTPLARDESGVVAETLRNGELFTCFLIDTKGTVQFCDALGMFHPANRYERMIHDVLEGQNIYLRWISELNRSEQEYLASLRQWIENGIFLKDVHTEKVSIPEKRTEKASTPVSCRLTEIWSSREIHSPSSLLPLPVRNRLLVLENGQSVAELNVSGKVLARHALGPGENEYFYRISTATAADGERFFAAEGNAIHVFDRAWKKILVYPEPEKRMEYGPLSALLLKDLDQDGEPEIYAAFRNGNEILRISLDGKVIGKAGGVSNVFKIAAVRRGDENELRVIDQSGGIFVFSAKEMNLREVQLIPQRKLTSLSVFDFDGDGNDELAGSALSEGTQFKAVGLTLDANEIWSIDLPDFVYPRKIEKVYPLFLKNEDRIQVGWVLIGPDSSIYFVESNGMLIDQFHFGKIVTGCVSTVLNGKPFLFLASPDGVTALEIAH